MVGLGLMVSSAPIFVVFLWQGVDTLGFADDALDRGHMRADGEVVAVESTGMHSASTRFLRIRFVFEADGIRYEGASFAPDSADGRAPFARGGRCVVEYAEADPSLSRARGTRLNPFGASWSLLLGAFFLPGIVLFLLWARAATRLRILLQSGTAVDATVASSRRKFGIHPPQLRVEYTFRDGASTRHGAHLVGRRTTLGKLIEAGAETVPAVFDPSDPDSSRLALHEDFVA